MRNKWSVKAIAWVLSFMMLFSSLGLNSLTVSAEETNPPGEEQSIVLETSEEESVSEAESEELSEETASVEEVEEISEAASEEVQSEEPVTEAEDVVDAAGDGFTYTANVTTGYNTATLDFTLDTVGGSAPEGQYKVSLYSKPSDEENFAQFTWGTDLSAEYKLQLSNIQYNWAALVPGKSYDLKIVLMQNNDTIGEAIVSFTTKAYAIHSTLNNVTWFSADYSFEVADKDKLEAAGINELTAYPFIQEKGGEAVSVNWSYYKIDLLKEDLKITGLKDETEYTLILSASPTDAKSVIYQTTFKTAVDTRKVEVSAKEIQYCYAKFNVKVSGGRDDVETKVYTFLRKKGTEEWKVQSSSETQVAFTKEFRVNELSPLTEYEYVIAISDYWDINQPDAIEKAKHKISGTFKTPEDPRELSVACSAGYQTALIQTSYTENNLSGVQSVIHVFVRKVGETEWIEKKNASYDQGNTFNLVFTDLSQDTEYEYRAILNSKWDGTTADDTVLPLQFESGTFKTELCKYTLTMTPDEEKSLYNREYLNVQLNGSNRDRFVTLEMLFDNDMEKKIALYRDDNYKDTFSLKDLSSNTTYYLAQYEIWVKEFGVDACIAQVECQETDYSFTTPEAVAPTFVKLEEKAIYLNEAQAEEENVGFVVLKPIVDDGTSDEMIWSVENDAVAGVDEDGKVTAKGVGTTNVTATSKYDANVSVTIPVYVGSFSVYYADTDAGVGDDVIKGLKGTQSPALYVKGRAYDESENATVVLTDSSAIRSSVVTFDKESGKITFGTVGSTKLYLEKDEYKVRINIESYVKTAAYYVSSVSNATYPGVEAADEENTYILVTGQEYQIDIKAINGEDVEDKNGFVVTMDPNPSQSITLDGLKITTTDVATDKPVKLTISPKEGSAYDNEYYSDAVIYVYVKELPEENEETLQIYTNVSKYLSDVKLSDGWKWEKEDTALYALKKTQRYDFNAYYAKEDKYPLRQTIKVDLAEIKNFIFEDVDKTHFTVTADGSETIQVKVRYSYLGQINFSDLSIGLKADSDDCTIELVNYDNTFATYEVSASKAGTYILTAELNSAVYGKAIASNSVTVTATDTAMVRSIKVKNTSLDTFVEDDKILFDSTLDLNKTVDLKAITYNYLEEEIAAPELIWSTTDKTVAQITPAGKTDTQNAKLLIKGAGNAIITVKSKDAAGISYSFVVEVENIAPHVDATNISVNTALDYEISEGRDIAYKFYGFVELVEAYDNEVTDWTFYKKTKKTFEQETALEGTDFKFYERTGVGNKKDILVMPAKANLKAGKYEMWLAVTTEESDTVYTYPVSVKVMNKQMKVKAVSDNVNTFYMLKNNADIAYTFTGDYINQPTVHWEDNTDDAIGFTVNKYVYYNQTKKKWCSNVGTESLEMNGKVPATGTTSGKLVISFKGYREPVEIKNFKIKNSYKIPKITTVAAKTTVSLECGIDKAAFYLYQKDAKRRIQYHDQEDKYFYSTYKVNCEEVNIYPTSDWSEYLEYVYSGEKKVENIVITLRSNYWREKVEVKHTINNVAPALILEKPNMTFNWNLPGADYSVLKVKNTQHGAVLKDLIVTGKGAEAQKLVDDNIFTFTMEGSGELKVKLNHLKALNKKMTKNATYVFNVVPVFENSVTGKEVTGKACALKVKTTSKEPTVKVSASGGIDLAKYPMINSWEFYKNAVKLKFSFANVNSNYDVISREIIGDYAKYFEIWWSNEGQGFYLVPKPGMEGKLKAGFVYDIQFKCTLQMRDGVTTVVTTTKPYKLKLKQSSVGVKVTPNTQIMYLSNEKVTRVYEAKLNNGYYHIDTITGSLDVNKDGKADFVIESVQKKDGDTAADITIKLVDRDAVSTTLKGKKYSIPIEIMVTGADGISKNIKTKITVTVKK